MQHSQLLKINIGPEVTATPVTAIDHSKPAVFIMSAELSSLGYSDRPGNHYLARFANEISGGRGDFNFYTYQGKATIDPSTILTGYNKDPHHYCTDTIRELVENVMLDTVPAMSKIWQRDRQEIVKRTKEILSRQVALGYSFGAEAIQEMVNGLTQGLKSRGFRGSEITECLEYFSAGTIGCSVSIEKKKHNAPQLHTMLEGDDKIIKRGSFRNLDTSDDPTPHANLNYSHRGNNLILVGTPEKLPDHYNLRTYATKLVRNPRLTPDPLDPIPDEARPTKHKTITNLIRKPGQEPRESWIMEVRQRDATPHDLYLNSNIERDALPELHTYGFNPAAIVFWEGMRQLMASAHIGYGNERYKAPTTIINQLKAEHLSAEGKQKAMDKVQQSMANYQSDATWIATSPDARGR